MNQTSIQNKKQQTKQIKLVSFVKNSFVSKGYKEREDFEIVPITARTSDIVLNRITGHIIKTLEESINAAGAYGHQSVLGDAVIKGKKGIIRIAAV